ncbi:MAG TPA: heavy-metal-associated domain-containing protein [Anaerolineae bacterium]|nr:heavy-metal-associated domain-containing protein [Anaerolineae bacterium]
MGEKTVHIQSISCRHCVATIKREIEDIDGVSAVDGDIATKMVTIRWNPPADWDLIKQTLDEIGYTPDAP